MDQRPLNSADLEKYLNANDIKGEVLHLSVTTPTVETAADALGVSTEAIVKSLLFLVDDLPVLAIACGTARVDNRRIAGEFGVGRKHVKLATPEVVMEIAGYKVGAMPPFGHHRRLQTVIDPAVTAQETVYAGGGSDNAMMRISSAELLRATEGKILPLLELSQTDAGTDAS